MRQSRPGVSCLVNFHARRLVGRAECKHAGEWSALPCGSAPPPSPAERDSGLSPYKLQRREVKHTHAYHDSWAYNLVDDKSQLLAADTHWHAIYTKGR
jgi:hypothetical protein